MSVQQDATAAGEHVWLLFHIHEEIQDLKMIGSFVDVDGARAAQRQLVRAPGFRDRPEGFWMVQVPLRVLNWGGYA